jgi:tetratricopeptide (TPR) repeat protein
MGPGMPGSYIIPLHWIRMWWLAKIIIVFSCLALIQARADTVLVLPFFNLSDSSNLDWIGESFAETIRESLTAQGVLTLSREDRQEALRRLSIRPYALLTRASVIKIAESLDAGQVIFGQYSLPSGTPPSKGGSLRVNSRILDLKRIKQGPELVEQGVLEDLAAIETHLAWQVAKALRPKTAPSEEDFRRAWPPVRVDAIENYIRGLLAASSEQKHHFFTQAARLDARFSQPCFQLGRLHTQKKEYRAALGWLERVDRADSHYFEAQFLLGICRYYTGNYAGAEASFRLVSESVPLNEVFNDLGVAQSRQNGPQTVNSFRKAIDGDAADPDYHFNLGYALWKRGQFDAAAESFRSALDRKPGDTDATLMLGRCLRKRGPRPGDPKNDGLERLKLNYEETAYRQLKAELGVK